MTYLQAIILGIVQGLAEFLPISSSGHLALIQNLLGIQGDKVVMFTVMLHMGTLVSVFIMYWSDIWALIKELFITIGDIFTGKGLRLQERPVRKLGVMIIVSTIPTAIMGFAFNDFFESLYSNIALIGAGFIITGFMLYLSEKFGEANRDLQHMNFRNAIFIGILQGVAIAPGISRSGSTMVGGLTVGLKRDFAVKFAFLISIPTILGSFLMEFKSAASTIAKSPDMFGVMAVGVVVAAICGIIAIKAMIKAVSDKKLKYFSYYVWALGAAVIIYSFVK
ncbi:MAG: undecaprenyl-diphosphate phosphatase [Eubacteriales bacterium]|nr:undecaprenyl-diphosphate phosphatase [Eubacteriales bacterium]